MFEIRSPGITEIKQLSLNDSVEADAQSVPLFWSFLLIYRRQGLEAKDAKEEKLRKIVISPWAFLHSSFLNLIFSRFKSLHSFS